MHARSSYSAWITGILFVVLAVGAVAPQALFAQTLTDARRAELQAQLNTLEKEIADNQAIVDKLAAQGKSLSTEVQTLNAQIKKAQLQVQATQVAIKSLDSSITLHQRTITTLTSKLDAEKESLAQILRRTNEIDNYSIVEVAFAKGDLSSLLGDLDSYALLKHSLGISYERITGTKLQTEVEKTALETKREEQQQIAQIQLLAKQRVQEQQQQKQQLLTTTKGQESKYKEVVAAKQKTAGQIRAELFSLAGGSGQIPLPTAIAYAKQAGGSTGIRPAFILGILKQETNIGKNVGTGNWRTDMHPTRDAPVFQVIMATLGLNPDSQKVSSAPSYGYGGAMGPGQFIPSTWACYGGYVNTSSGGCGKGTDGTYAGPWQYNAAKDRVAKAAGHPGTPSNPWNNLDAFTATAIYMADLGAAAQTPEAERTAALKYFAGGNYKNPAYAFYGDSVMSFAAQFQSDISTLAGG